MRRPTLLVLTVVFSILGIADSWYLAQHALTNTALSCGINVAALSGCNTVAQSAYAHFFGIPLGVYGLVFYGLVFACAATLHFKPINKLPKVLLVLGVLGALFSFYFVGLQVFVIKAICIYCFGSFFLSLGIFATTLLFVRSRSSLPPLM